MQRRWLREHHLVVQWIRARRDYALLDAISWIDLVTFIRTRFKLYDGRIQCLPMLLVVLLLLRTSCVVECGVIELSCYHLARDGRGGCGPRLLMVPPMEQERQDEPEE